MPSVIANKGGRTTPSVVATKDGKRLIGDIAASVRQRLIGSYNHLHKAGKWARTGEGISTGNLIPPQEMSAFILMKLKKDAEDYLGESVNDTVITVPAYFNVPSGRRQRCHRTVAGTQCAPHRHVNLRQPRAYGLDHGQTQTVLVYDLGGGTFDVSIIRMGDSVIEVLATTVITILAAMTGTCVFAIICWTLSKTGKIKLDKDMTAMSRVLEGG